QPYVTAVGGTQLSLLDNLYGVEAPWTASAAFKNGWSAGGGGKSANWTLPDWQNAPGVPDTTFSSPQPCSAQSGQWCREIPDVSLNAASTTPYIAYCSVNSDPLCQGHTWLLVYGTSVAAPLWAAMMALANEKSLHDTAMQI